MKKTAIAIAALVASGASFAQSSVTLYGIADVFVGKVKGASAQLVNGGVSGSRWGLKGNEDLGGGMNAVFNFEQAVDLTTGAAAGFNRQANVGFESGMGTVKLGRSYTALDDMFGAANSGFDSALSANAIWQNGYTASANAQLYYATPEFAGFKAAASTQLKGNVGIGTGKLTTFNVTYAGGPIYAGLGFEDDAVGQKGTMLNGSYDLGVAKLLGSYYTTKPKVGVRTNSFQLGADIPVSSMLTVSVGYASSKVSGGAKDSGFGVAAAYSLSKRTTVYAGFRAESRKSAIPDGDVYAVGIKHTF